jgi:hypothetical protein|tara:strand:+ start:188 stop:406 length:219 start_codon:yes stop_codon:yes gene_type:complete
MPKIKKPQTLVKWGHKEITALELFEELNRLVADPVRNLYELDGDMYLSDYRKLCDAQWQITVALDKYKGDKE